MNQESDIDYASLLGDGSPLWERLIDKWAARYRTEIPRAELLVVDLGTWSYFFHLTATEPDSTIANRVVAAWGKSAHPVGTRDRTRMRGHPGSVRPEDHKGHLIAHASGGGLDINLIKMDGGLNTGRTPDGKKFRAMERYCARHPGTPFFIRPIYEDDTDRPRAFDAGVYQPRGWWFEVLQNG